ncbi:MAG TPA: hypothetical protein VK711_05470 [Puia sp.]|jgi:hypothetical protein|nr:hypothetical protein [Puia sp.]
MKKYITCTLLSITISYIIHAQENVHPDITQISKPFTDLTQGSFRGKNLLFEGNWVKGKLLTSNNSIVNGDNFLFNFDKIEHRLLITADYKNMFEIDRREFKAALFYFNDSAYVFKHIYFINDKDLFQILVNDETRYSLYKVVHTKLIKETFGINTISTPGNTAFREKYVDMPEYYIFFPNREYRSIFTLKKGPIERIFELNPDSEKVNEFLKLTNSKVYDENELIQLILFLNKASI